jgi:hypothetical protein
MVVGLLIITCSVHPALLPSVVVVWQAAVVASADRTREANFVVLAGLIVLVIMRIQKQLHLGLQY